jgi:hypothetical protein
MGMYRDDLRSDDLLPELYLPPRVVTRASNVVPLPVSPKITSGWTVIQPVP